MLWKRFLLTVFLFLAFNSNAVGQTGVIDRLVIPADSLKGNLLGDPVVQPALVYLPTGYAQQPMRRYPVLYMLHGFSLHSILNDWAEVISESMDAFVRAHPEKAFIVVIPNGANSVHGSFYLDSKVNGNWEHFISADLVGYIDAHYRTIPDRKSRAIAGHSMGGFATLRLIMLHPDTFAVGYAMSPCCLDLQADMTDSNPAWRVVLRMDSIADIQAAADKDEFWPVALSAFALAASPDVRASRKADLPYKLSDDKVVGVPAVINRWRAIMPLGMVTDHRDALAQATGIAIDYGYQDEFSHIPITCLQFGDELQSFHIPIWIEGYNGNHNDGVPPRVSSRLIPFVAEHIQFK